MDTTLTFDTKTNKTQSNEKGVKKINIIAKIDRGIEINEKTSICCSVICMFKTRG